MDWDCRLYPVRQDTPRPWASCISLVRPLRPLPFGCCLFLKRSGVFSSTIHPNHGHRLHRPRPDKPDPALCLCWLPSQCAKQLCFSSSKSCSDSCAVLTLSCSSPQAETALAQSTIWHPSSVPIRSEPHAGNPSCCSAAGKKLLACLPFIPALWPEINLQIGSGML